MKFKAGQSWSYRSPEGFETSRIVIGAIATFGGRPAILCCSVSGAPQREPDGSIVTVDIPFLPIEEAALSATVTSCDEPPTASIGEGFAEGLDQWQSDPRGLSCFTVPFDGYLDRLIAHQMAAIVGTDAA
ncbi:MAG: hypothetical protein AB7E80_01155 [Hyphomicrobiaceae bacterium]